KELIAACFEASYIEGLFKRTEIRFEPKVMPRKLTHDEYKLNYAQFLRAERIKRAQDFLERYRPILARISRDYHVSAEVMTAIALIETDCGRIIGKHRIFNILASLAVSKDWSRVRKFLPQDLSPEDEARLKKRMLKKSRWAFKELCALIRFARENQIDPLNIKGSIFGAFGLPQFMPSSAIHYGVDGNGDGRIDLFDPEDALASMANYLRQNGYREDLPESRKIQAIMRYNWSRPYAETVLKVARKLKDRG
ncbi:lytic murein transglycosylase, partial [Thermosulfuriphilus sp.]